MNNIQVSTSDGTIVASANTYGAYIFKPTGTCAGADNGGWGSDYTAPCWEQLFTATSAPLTLTGVNNLQQGSLEVTSCNNNTSDAYGWFNKNLYVTTNLKAAASSRLWANTGLTNSIGGNQGVSAGTGPALACDPANPNVIYAATPAGVNVSGNGLSGASASFAIISTAKIGTTGAIPSAIAFDPTASSGTCSAISGSPTCTQHFWIFTSGTGVYETYNGGTAFTLTSSGPTTASSGCGQGGFCFRIKADQFGTLWAIIGDAKLYKYVPNGTAGGGTWTNSTPGVYNSQVAEFAIDPTSGSSSTLRIAAAGDDANIALSTNGAGAWTGHALTMGLASSGSQPPWIANANQYSGGVLTLAMQDMSFDASGNLWSIGGIGAFEVLSASVAVNATWNSNNLGMEQLVANHVASCSGNSPVVNVWDRGFFVMQNPDVFPADYWPDYSYSHAYGIINAGWAVDCATASNTNFFTGWAGTDNNVGASSSDGGTTWTVWPSFGAATTNIGGAIAASSSTNWVWVPAAAGGGASQVWYTTNGATGWTQSTLTGATTPFANTSGYGFPLAADSVTAGNFCIIDNGLNIWSTTNNGATFSKVNTGVLAGVKYNDALKAVPGQAGIFYYSGGNAGGNTTIYNIWKITKTTNECDTATKVSTTITDIYGFGYGAPIPGGNGFPTIYFYGEVSGTIGLYEIDNGGSTPTLISAPTAAQSTPNNSTDFVKDVSGDLNVYGRIYVGFNGSGFAYIDTQNACPWVNFTSAFKPTSSLTGTVTLQAQKSGLVPVTAVDFYVDGTLIGRQTSGTGTPVTYSQSWVTGGVATGAHTLKVLAEGSTNANCTTSLSQGNSFSIPITTH